MKPHRLAVLAVTWLVGTTLMVSCGGNGSGGSDVGGGGGREDGGTTAAPPASSTEGSGVVATEVRSVSGFTSVVLAGEGIVRIDAGVAEQVEVTADDNLLSHLTTVVEDGTLVLDVDDDRGISPSTEIVYRVGAELLDGVAITGIGELDARGIGADAFDATLDGVGTIRLAGSTDDLIVHIAGSGSIDAGMLATSTASATVDGAGDITVAPTDSLDATISGSGSIAYVGDPTVHRTIDGTGTVAPVAGELAPPAPVTELPVIPAPSLEGNLLDDPAELHVSVWLPPSYATSSARYPVVYYLAGFDEGPSTTEIGRALQDLVEAGEAPEMILVGASGANALGGSFYTDSPVSGNWASAVHTDLVRAVDQRYRTIAAPESRGIAGFSMGGFGALDLAMRHPDVFGAVYALSPGLFAPGGMETSQMFADPDVVEGFLTMQQSVAEGDTTPQMGTDVRFSRAYGSAFAPDVDTGPPWVAYPYDDVGGPPDPAIWDRWDSGFGGVEAEIDEFQGNLARLRGIAIDVGVNDSYRWIPEGVRHMAEQLDEHGIPAQVSVYEGGHGPVGPRASEVMFPFFSEVLETA